MGMDFRLTFSSSWFMYRWKLTSFIVFASLFWTISVASASLTWIMLGWALRPEFVPKEEIKGEERDLVKDEPETEDSSSHSGAVKVKEEPEELGISTLLESYPEVDDGGMGSGLESAEGRGMQKRRSHLTEYDR